MKTAMKIHQHTITEQETSPITDAITQAWQKIAPFWPLKNLIAVNPLQGLENLPIEEALVEGASYFQQATIPEPMEAINRETIKWLQAFCDEGQATITMPCRNAGLYAAWRNLAKYDKHLHENNTKKQDWLATLPEHAEQAIAECLLYLGIAQEDRTQFLTLLLTTLSGWAAHINYRTQWSETSKYPYPVTQADYLAVRLAITCLLWKDAKLLLTWHKEAYHSASRQPGPLKQITENETQYRLPLLKQLAAHKEQEQGTVADAQFVFCIDVRSEPFRRALEATGNYETFGFAGFFGVPVQIENAVTGESYASCPVLLSPKHRVKELPLYSPRDHKARENKSYANSHLFKRLYQSLKYNFTTPFALVETLGLASGIWMGLRSFTPAFAYTLKTRILSTIRPPLPVTPTLDDIPFADQCNYAENALRMMGLTQHFAPLVVLCGHGSTTQNNAYATALDCGACGGRHGASNARILATILNTQKIRDFLAKNNIIIPHTTRFIAAQHNTTTDEVELYAHEDNPEMKQLKNHLEKARQTNSQWRCGEMGITGRGVIGSAKHTVLRSQDPAQVRPEWGLAGNASFIIAPRAITRPVNLKGRSFLHSYDYQQDPEGTSLTAILTAPMVVAQWINAQYLFSTLDNVAFGGGSKITKNITGKLGIMQGNASDLMTGLPLQSVYSSDTETYHELQRLMTVVYAPRRLIDNIIATQDVLKKLFGNGWVTLACIDPVDKQTLILERDLSWRVVQ